MYIHYWESKPAPPASQRSAIVNCATIATPAKYVSIFVLVSFHVSKCRLFVDRDSTADKHVFFFLGKCVRTAAKTMVVDRSNAANSSEVPTEFVGGDQLSSSISSSNVSSSPWLVGFDFSFVTVMVNNFSVYKVFLLRSQTQQKWSPRRQIS